MELLVRAGAAWRLGGRDHGNSSPPSAHDEINSLALFAEVEYGATSNLATPSVIIAGRTF